MTKNDATDTTADDPTTWAGYRYHTRRAVVVNNEEAGLDTAGGPWGTVCRLHDIVIAHDTRKAAGSFVHHPEEWCEMCAHEEDRSDWVDGEKPPAIRKCRCGFTGTRQAVAGHIKRATGA